MAPLLLVHDKDQVWIIYVVAFLYGVSWVVIPGALNGLLKEMLPEDLLVDANASLSTTKEALRLFGPLVGAGAVHLGRRLVRRGARRGVVRGRRRSPSPRSGCTRTSRSGRPDTGRPSSVRASRHIWHDAVLKHTLLAVAMALLVVGFMESAVFAAVDSYDKPASYVGVVISVQGVGAVLGGISSSLDHPAHR